MKFLLSANRMSRGYARVRQWLIMAMRVLAIAGLIFAVSRPLASGWLGVTAGGDADTTIVLLDRSPSMQQQGAGSGISKLDTARAQLVETLETLGSAHYVLIDSAAAEPQEMTSPASLIDSPQTTGVSASADLPAMLQAAYDYVKANNPGRTEIWIASDLRENDWQADDGRWASLREAFTEFPQEVRFHLLAYAPGSAASKVANASIRVTEARREQVGDRAELVLSLVIERDVESDEEADKQTLPLRFEIDGARSEMNVALAGTRFELKDHRMPLSAQESRGWGKVSLPADANPADDEAYFVFDEPTVRRTAIVAEAEDRVRALKLAASISPLPSLESEAQIVSPDNLNTLAWEELALVLWQAPLPKGETAEQLEAYVDRGGQVIFFPPRDPSANELFGMQWQGWVEPKDALTPDTWRSDQDLLAKTNSGAALPVGKWKVMRYCTLGGEANPLATLPGGAPLVSRVVTDRGGVYFCATTADSRDSTFAADGVVLYVALQRVIDNGAAVLGNARSQTAGDPLPAAVDPWRRTVETDAEDILSTDYRFHRGVYASGDKLIAVNRPAAEDAAATVPDARVDQLFAGLDFDRVDQQAGSGGGLVQEVWRLFLGLMMVALLVEAALCLPRVATPDALPLTKSPPAIPPRQSISTGNSTATASEEALV